MFDQLLEKLLESQKQPIDTSCQAAETVSIQAFHGTNFDIKGELKPSRSVKAVGNIEGIYLTSNKQEAAEYGKNIIKAEITFNNPFEGNPRDYYAEQKGIKTPNLDKKNMGLSKEEWSDYRSVNPENIKSFLIAQGYDGVIINKPSGKEYIVFYPEQIKDVVSEGLVEASLDDLKKNKFIFWHGTPSGDLRGGANGLHVGSYQAAKEALEARIGVPADGVPWNGTRVYGKTLLAGTKTLKEIGVHETGFNCDLPENDFYPEERKQKATYGDSSVVSLSSTPDMIPMKITGPMVNTRSTAYEDFKANALMRRQVTRGQAKRGIYYTNVAEDEGSLSAVVPSKDHLEVLQR